MVLIESGQLFHSIGAITEKVRFPKVSKLYLGTANSSLLAERNECFKKDEPHSSFTYFIQGTPHRKKSKKVGTTFSISRPFVAKYTY